MAASSRRKTSSSNKKTALRTAARGAVKKRTSSRRKKAEAQRLARDSALFHEIGLIVLFTAMVLLFCCNFGIIGPVGNAVSGVLFGLFGLTAYIVPILLFLAAAFWFANEGNSNAARKLIAGILLFVIAGVVFDLLWKEKSADAEYNVVLLYESCRDEKAGGGILGGSIGFCLQHYLGTLGTVLVVLVCSVVCLILLTEKSLLDGLKRGSRRMRELSREDARRRREEAERRREEAEQRREEAARYEEERRREERKRYEEAAEGRRGDSGKYGEDAESLGLLPQGYEENAGGRRGDFEKYEEDAEEHRGSIGSRRGDFKRRREESRLRRQAQEEQRRLRAEEKENEKILRMERKFSGVMLDTALSKPEKSPYRDEMHEIILPEEKEELKEQLQQNHAEPIVQEKAHIENAQHMETVSFMEKSHSTEAEKTADNLAAAVQENSAAFEQWDMQDLPVRIYKEGMEESETLLPSGTAETSGRESYPFGLGERTGQNSFLPNAAGTTEEQALIKQEEAGEAFLWDNVEMNFDSMEEKHSMEEGHSMEKENAMGGLVSVEEDQFTETGDFVDERFSVGKDQFAETALSMEESDFMERAVSMEGTYSAGETNSVGGEVPMKAEFSMGTGNFEEGKPFIEDAYSAETGNSAGRTAAERVPYASKTAEQSGRGGYPSATVNSAAGVSPKISTGPGAASVSMTGTSAGPGTAPVSAAGIPVRPGTAPVSATGIPVRPGTAPVSAAGTPVRPGAVSESTGTAGVGTAAASARPAASAVQRPPGETAGVSPEMEAGFGQEIADNAVKLPKKYIFPPITLLQKGKAVTGDSVRELKETAMHLQQTLSTFGVKVTITDISQGPSVTRYELQPEQGVKVSKIVGLTDDIKLNLAAMDIRIEAPIPGKAAIGIEVPNKESMTVALRDLLETAEFRDFPSNIAFAVGKDIAGKVIVTDIAKMPHMLIAGATGSGKSVCINTLIMSILYKAHPDDVKLIMVDPKVVELSVYNGIPHLLIPVVTDPKKASAALHWGVAEMEDRYRKFAEYNVRDLKGYNKKVEAMQEKGMENAPKKLPQIVIIVDELADLMMVCPGEVEESICRLAQLARAAGIHLIIATQRPSVDVITGLIKANMPSRVAFSVSSGVDSRTILDMVGAEKLLGKGDMLFYPQGYAKPARVQGAFVSDNEVSDVVDFMKNQALGNTYAAEIEEKIKNMGSSGSGSSGGSEVDELFEKAGRLIIDKDKASIGMLQRALQIGFNRAARIMDQLCSHGVVGEEEGTKPRKILMSPEQFEQLLEEV